MVKDFIPVDIPTEKGRMLIFGVILYENKDLIPLIFLKDFLLYFIKYSDDDPIEVLPPSVSVIGGLR